MTALPVERHRPMTPPHIDPDPAPADPDRERAELLLAVLPTAPSTGRRFVTAHLRKWGLDDLIDACELVASELVTNAVTAAGDRGVPQRSANPPDSPAEIILRLRLTGPRLLCEVWDGSEHPPVPAHAGDFAEHGRGLLLVAGLCTGWGYRFAPSGGKVVLAWWDLH